MCPEYSSLRAGPRRLSFVFRGSLSSRDIALCCVHPGPCVDGLAGCRLLCGPGNPERGCCDVQALSRIDV